MGLAPQTVPNEPGADPDEHIKERGFAGPYTLASPRSGKPSAVLTELSRAVVSLSDFYFPFLGGSRNVSF